VEGGVEGAAEQVTEDWERKISMLEGLMSGEGPDIENPDDIDDALGMMEGLLKLMQDDLPTDGDLDVQKLRLPPRCKAEQALGRYAVVGRVMLNITSQAISALPFGAPVATVLKSMWRLAEQVRATADATHRPGDMELPCIPWGSHEAVVPRSYAWTMPRHVIACCTP
jgi:hypothetical protein